MMRLPGGGIGGLKVWFYRSRRRNGSDRFFAVINPRGTDNFTIMDEIEFLR